MEPPILQRTENGLELRSGRMALRGDFTRMAARLAPGKLQQELLVRAARIKGANGPLRAIDATAGLGEDSLLLAAAGFEVELFERDETIAALLADALERAASDERLAPLVARMHLTCGDSIEALKGYANLPADACPDVVLLDPMFPAKQHDSAVKKKLQLLQMLEQPCEDEAALLDAAYAAQPRKIVVKRPAKGPNLANRTPSYSLRGKAIRYDVYVLAR